MGTEHDGGGDRGALVTHDIDPPPGLSSTPTVTASADLGVGLREVITPAGVPPALAERYTSLALLGRGGMGAVYRAFDRTLGRAVAIKILTGGQGREGLIREARAQAKLDHDHVCAIYEVEERGDTPYIVMRYIDGAPLGRAADTMTLDEKVHVVRQVALALHEAHLRGLIHRDVKPSNILIERTPRDGVRPYLTDFGIAREVGAGDTVSGAIAGTPAYMAPEQARGEVHSLDGRTDVYGLGATLYHVLAGRPPFEAKSPLLVLERVLRDDPAPLRRLRPDVPADLDAVVIRCLEKDPDKRYATAALLAGDLARFLGGEPVSARRPSAVRTVIRWAKKRRGALAVGLAVTALLVVIALWARERRASAEAAKTARELGEVGKEMELFLRSAYGLPLHDVERERDVVRARLRAVARPGASGGPIVQGPLRYALGRGHLALGEPRAALAHLEAARAAGYTSFELDYAMGLSLGEIYDEERSKVDRITDPSRRAAKLADLTATYVTPATRHLRAALGAPLEAPAYVEGLLALREGKLDEALARARAASAAAPWLYEAKRLEGDCLFAKGSKHRHDAAFDYDAMMVDFRAAAEAYRAAAEQGRSDPKTHEAECELWTQIMNASTGREAELRAGLERARASCERAIAASPKGPSARIKLAFALASYAWLLATGSSPGDPTPMIRDAVARAREAETSAPSDSMALYALGLARGAEARYQNSAGIDSRAAVERSIAGFEAALRLDPGFSWAHADLASGHIHKAVEETNRGEDPIPSLERAVEACRRALTVDPESLTAIGTQAAAELLIAERLVDLGQSPERPVARARALIEVAEVKSPDWPNRGYYLAYADWLEARFVTSTGGDPSAILTRGEAAVAEQQRRSPSSPDLYEVTGRLAALRASYRYGRGEDDTAALREARAAFDRAVAEKPWDIGLLVLRAEVDVAALRRAVKARAASQTRFAEARAPLMALLSSPRSDPNLYRVIAAIDAIEAHFRIARGEGSAREIEHGLSMIERALSIHPNMASALAVRGELVAARARAGGARGR